MTKFEIATIETAERLIESGYETWNSKGWLAEYYETQVDIDLATLLHIAERRIRFIDIIASCKDARITPESEIEALAERHEDACDRYYKLGNLKDQLEWLYDWHEARARRIKRK